MQLDINNYPGSKNSSGVIPFLVNNTPDCRTFVDAFGGSGVVSSSIAKLKDTNLDKVLYYDVNTQVCHDFKLVCPTNILVRNESFFDIYGSKNADWNFGDYDDSVFFCDPPYKFSTRKSKRSLYGFHEWTDEDHERFLNFIRTLGAVTSAKIMITHPMCDLYSKYLLETKLRSGVEWIAKPFSYMTRGGKMEDFLWTNFDIDEEELLSYDFLGVDQTDRQRIKRKTERNYNRFMAMPFHERQAILRKLSTLQIQRTF